MDSNLIDRKNSEKSSRQWRKQAKEWFLLQWKESNLKFD